MISRSPRPGSIDGLNHERTYCGRAEDWPHSRREQSRIASFGSSPRNARSGLQGAYGRPSRGAAVDIGFHALRCSPGRGSDGCLRLRAVWRARRRAGDARCSSSSSFCRRSPSAGSRSARSTRRSASSRCSVGEKADTIDLPPPGAPLEARTALLFPVYHEDPARIAGTVQAIAQELESMGAATAFDVFMSVRHAR